MGRRQRALAAVIGASSLVLFFQNCGGSQRTLKSKGTTTSASTYSGAEDDSGRTSSSSQSSSGTAAPVTSPTTGTTTTTTTTVTTPAPSLAGCSFQDKFISSGATIKAYAQPSVYAQTCDGVASTTLSCYNGSLSAPAGLNKNDYPWASCTPNLAGGSYTYTTSCTSCNYSACGDYGSSYTPTTANFVTGGDSCPAYAPNKQIIQTGGHVDIVTSNCSTAYNDYAVNCTR